MNPMTGTFGIQKSRKAVVRKYEGSDIGFELELPQGLQTKRNSKNQRLIDADQFQVDYYKSRLTYANKHKFGQYRFIETCPYFGKTTSKFGTISSLLLSLGVLQEAEYSVNRQHLPLRKLPMLLCFMILAKPETALHSS